MVGIEGRFLCPRWSIPKGALNRKKASLANELLKTSSLGVRVAGWMASVVAYARPHASATDAISLGESVFAGATASRLALFSFFDSTRVPKGVNERPRDSYLKRMGSRQGSRASMSGRGTIAFLAICALFIISNVPNAEGAKRRYFKFGGKFENDLVY